MIQSRGNGILALMVIGLAKRLIENGFTSFQFSLEQK